MSEFKFACPSCQQRIAADSTWSGQQINCPACNSQITVPAAPAPAPAPGAAPPPAPASSSQPPAAPVPPPVGRLSVSQHAPAEAAPKPPAPMMTYGQPKVVQKPGGSSAGKTAGLVVAGVVILVGLVFAGLKYRQQKAAQKAEAEAVAEAEAKAAKKVADAAAAAAQAAATKTSNATAAATAALPPPSGGVPMSAADRRSISEAESRYGKASVTLDPLDAASVPDPTLIPDKPASGTVQNEVFQITKATYQAGWLTLGEGTGALPDRSVKFNLSVPSTESLEGRTFKRPDSKDRRPLTAQTKGKRSTGNFPSGFALSLEFGRKQGGVIPGKIYFSVPGTGTVTNIVTGTFTAEMK